MHENNSNGNCIIVIPFLPIEIKPVLKLEIDKLYFWYKNTFDHPVNDETLKFFLFHVQLFGATVYPKCPEIGCISINVAASLNNGEAAVNQIHFNGQMIYSRNKGV